MTYDQTYALVNAGAWFVVGVIGTYAVRATARAVGDWLIRWRLAGHHCNHCQEEKR